jgi:hypothetical protein
MAPLTSAQISIDRWSKLLLIGCVILILVSGPALMSCGRRHHAHPQPDGQDSDAVAAIATQRSLAGLGLATGMTGVVAAFRPSRCGVALFLVGVHVVLLLALLRVKNHFLRSAIQCMDSARPNVDQINACADSGKRAGITAMLIIGFVALCFDACGGRLGRGVAAREQEERVEAEADALRDAIVAGAAVPIVVGSCDLAPLPAYVLAVEGTACVDPTDDCHAQQQQRHGGAA